MIVTIDGPAGSGKSTAARGLAARLGYEYLDTGAMFRAVALTLLDRGVDPATWSRGRGWGLWKALITLVGYLDEGDEAEAAARRIEIGRILADHAEDR